ncbi:2-desacetyl-2-hydroxyethyl bacteriochlorophyllide A dehydrogenase [Roseiarcus fermentans]|uniref:2-desacetyl-2-hydroxyethyl bacteriochlorophyllide A dehydrogenase n=1 Tax=Roseiarcus fermentans TaxID=1473586 RepID=A0A366FND4_9HYPH|nr:alcohol dehydrogenase catalytic domain-containing protein [Roseiarcus fermentans]RBP16071.1 2-desacetyl-2-hydroxyethyl bacteriochlorophyllide A dehydrogenase [Roseiarcus fermentans]
MKAIVFDGPGRIALRDSPEPTLVDATDALVRVTLAGICGTDLHVVAGHFHGVEPGAVVGHEFVGDVVAVGAGVRNIKVGDHVVASDFSACGRCRSCDRGDHWECPERAFFGAGASFGPPLSGAQAELVRAPFADTTLSKVPAGVSDEAAILVSDNLATGWAAIERGRLEAGETVAIIGGGAVGQLTSLAAQAAGAAAVVVVEPSELRRDFARANGALAADPMGARDLLGKLTDGEGADVVVEAVGASATLSSAFDLVRKRGRVVSVGAHAAEEWPLPLARCFANEITLTFAIGDSIRLRPRLFALIRSGVLDPTVVVQERLTMDQVLVGYRKLSERQILKAVIDPRR